jgi:uncharacterized protein YkwD
MISSFNMEGRMFAMRHKLLIGVLSLASVLTLLLAVGAWSVSHWSGASPQQVSGKYNSYSAYAPVSATPTPPPATPTPSPIPRPPTATPTSGGNTGSSSGPTAFEQQIAQTVFQAINTDRASAGLPALQWSSALAGGAYKHSLLMSGNNQMAHQLPGEPGIGTRISQDGVQWTWCGENIGYTSNTTASGALWLHQTMMAEQPPNDGHRQNILSTNFTMVGIAIVIDANHRLWLTEDFAN